ncbi:hypothetical protein [Stutzerimonas kunmingensis]|uniref:hypothetical protein n=1 Tax=Stutzerimonas kunmingensis TaxID=1211807 RepID=UPI0021072F09|nr:hypothetical protein [Stutzerimonas kunmingensis]MCQ2034439.1 hypothetical protein [Stutzerimonas kunmingensis]
MSPFLKPCPCGYIGALSGMQHQGVFYSLTCPECHRSVEALTLEGLVENWNKPAEPVQVAEEARDV